MIDTSGRCPSQGCDRTCGTRDCRCAPCSCPQVCIARAERARRAEGPAAVAWPPWSSQAAARVHADAPVAVEERNRDRAPVAVGGQMGLL